MVHIALKRGRVRAGALAGPPGTPGERGRRSSGVPGVLSCHAPGFWHGLWQHVSWLGPEGKTPCRELRSRPQDVAATVSVSNRLGRLLPSRGASPSF